MLFPWARQAQRPVVRHRRRPPRALVIGTLLLAAGCGGAAPGDAANGARIYSGDIPIAGGNAPDCIGCHAVEPGEPGGAGPNLSNVGARAGSTIQGMPAEDYLRASIVDPDAYLAGGFQEGIHFRGYREALTAQQVEDLVAYLLTLRSGQDG